MKQISGKEFARVIRRKGWSLARVHGRRERIVVPVHGSRPLKIGLLRALMRIGLVVILRVSCERKAI